MARAQGLLSLTRVQPVTASGAVGGTKSPQSVRHIALCTAGCTMAGFWGEWPSGREALVISPTSLRKTELGRLEIEIGLLSRISGMGTSEFCNNRGLGKDREEEEWQVGGTVLFRTSHSHGGVWGEQIRFITSAQSRTHIHTVAGRQLRVHELPFSRGRKEAAKPPDTTVLQPLPHTIDQLVIVSPEITQNTCA